VPEKEKKKEKKKKKKMACSFSPVDAHASPNTSATLPAVPHCG